MVWAVWAEMQKRTCVSLITRAVLSSDYGRKMANNREFKIRNVAVPVPVVDKSRYQIAMFGQRYEKVESLKCVRSPSPSTHLKHFFMTRGEQRNLVTRFVQDGDGDGHVTNLNLPIIYISFSSKWKVLTGRSY